MGNPVGEPIRLGRRRHTLAAVMARCADPRRPHMVSVHRPGEPVAPEDHTVVLRAAWATRLVRPDEIVLITYIPLGGGAGGQNTAKQIGSAVAMLALAVAAPYVATGLLASASSATGVMLSYNAFTAAHFGISAGLVVGPTFTRERTS
ncbi:hypothetical protein GJ689_07745 [Rhodoplanes serenus]|uniref:Uncharacterized protein n=1 Tax=Rhodoplanes serenus TaxID=200615 RepID=A0A9X5AS86_9BRAD|nr:hypothetical protein [Rhodoplanes serenus]MTW16099.1 hypothetical protein [Rhodoplanes serenus]